MNNSALPVLYGIKNCDSIKKARVWMADNRVDYVFHDYHAEGIDARQLAHWCQQISWQTLLNRRGTTWRKLPGAQRENLDEAKAIALMGEQPAMIKRPVLEVGDQLVVGFSQANYHALLL